MNTLNQIEFTWFVFWGLAYLVGWITFQWLLFIYLFSFAFKVIVVDEFRFRYRNNHFPFNKK